MNLLVIVKGEKVLGNDGMTKTEWLGGTDREREIERVQWINTRERKKLHK